MQSRKLDNKECDMCAKYFTFEVGIKNDKFKTIPNIQQKTKFI